MHTRQSVFNVSRPLQRVRKDTNLAKGRLRAVILLQRRAVGEHNCCIRIHLWIENNMFEDIYYYHYCKAIYI